MWRPFCRRGWRAVIGASSHLSGSSHFSFSLSLLFFHCFFLHFFSFLAVVSDTTSRRVSERTGATEVAWLTRFFYFLFFFSLCFRWSFFHFPPSHRAPKNRKKFKKYGVAHRHPNRVRWTQKEPEKKKKTIKKEPGRKSDDGVSRCGPTIKKKKPPKKSGNQMEKSATLAESGYVIDKMNR